jgi:hypothetical protein
LAKNDKLLKEIRENYTYFSEAMHDIREAAKKDMKYVSGNPWEDTEREFRRKHDRPIMSWDELSPYINQLVNDPRQNKRSIKVSPRGSGATNQTAQLREDHIRALQYNSRAQSAFTTAFQGAAERGYGYFGINARLVANNLTDEQYEDLVKKDPGKLFEQELYIYRIPDPDSVLFNQNYKEQDCSDSTECFVEENISRAEFKRCYPGAEFLDWNPDFVTQAPGWQHEKEVRVAAYWKVIIRKRKLLLLDVDTKNPVAMYEDELDEVEKGWSEKEQNRKRISRDRTIETKAVKQYKTNGLEILEQSSELPIRWIPIVAVLGKEMWVDEGSGSKRNLISLVRMARDPYMFYCYLRSQEAEEFGMSPKSPFIGYTGQFETFKDQWATANKIPWAYLQADPTTTSEGQVLPLPTRPQFVPNAQAYEIAAEAARRAIRTAMGGSDLPTSAQRMNEKSGVALKEIEANEDRGTFHFIDNYNFSLEHAGRILDSWYPYIYDTKRDIGIEKADQEQKMITINDPNFVEKGPNGEAIQAHYDAVTGEHGVSISVGKDFNSQRDEAKDFVNQLVAEIGAIATLLPPGAGAKLLALGIRLQQLGPLGDEMADVLDPPADDQQKQQQLAQLQASAQQQQLVMQEMQKELAKLRLEKAGKVVDHQFKMQEQQIQLSSDERITQLNVDVQVLKALLASKQNISDQEYETFRTVWQENHGSAHELALQAHQQQHEQTLAASQQQHEQNQAALQPEEETTQ